MLWAAPVHRQGLHPAVLSWSVAGDDWPAEFDWTGTRDPMPWLAAPAGLDFMRDVPCIEAMRSWNHGLAWRAAQDLAGHWQRPFTTPGAMVGCMAAVPLPERLGPADAGNAQRVRDALFFGHAIEIAVIAARGTLQARVSIQVYNDAADIEHLADAVARL